MTFARNFAIVMLVALGLTAMPGGDQTLNVVMTILSVLFFTAIALFGYRLYRENQFALDSLSERQRLVLYGSIGGAFLTFTATPRLFDQGGAGVVVWLALLALFSYGVMWVWMTSRRYG